MLVNSDTTFSPDTDARRLALEVIATLCNIKKVCAEQVLRRADVPDDMIRRFLTERDPTTGEKRSKREAGSMILDELARRGDDQVVIRKLIKLAASWTAFHLAQDEYDARGVVQKARALDGALAEMDEREKAEHDRQLRESTDRQRREKEQIVRRESALLLAQFEQAALDGDPQQRGYLLEDLLNRLFNLHGIKVIRSFRRNEGGEQIDAAFEMEGWNYLVECRWRDSLADIRQLDGLAGQVGRSGRQTMGLFLSINGWSKHVVPLLKQNPDKNIFLMEGYDLRWVLDLRADLRELLKGKLSALNLDSEPYFSVARLLG
jgi:hypothetical protein